MKERYIKLICLVSALIMLLSLLGCGASGGAGSASEISESTPGKDLKLTAAADNVFSLNSNSNYSFNPLIATNHANQLICDLVYDNMLELDNNFNVIEDAGVVTAQTTDGGTTWVLTIKEGLTFHDGDPIMGTDIRRSLESAIYADRYSGRFRSFAGAAHTDNSVTVVLQEPNTQFDKLLNIPVIKHGTYGDPYPIGSGPYTYNEDHTALVAYEGHPKYGTLPVDTIYIKEFVNSDEVISGFESSLIDVVVNDPSSYTNLGYASSNEIHSFATTNMHFVAFNEDTSIMGRMEYFRYAMNYAFDRAYLEELLEGNAVASAIPMYPTAKIYPNELNNKFSYNLETCVKLLANAGIRDSNGDGKMDYINGAAAGVVLELVVCSDSSAKAGVVRRFTEDMASIGITVNVHELVWSDYIETLQKGEFDMYYAEVKLRNDFDITELITPVDPKVWKVDWDEDERPTEKLNFTRGTDQTALTYLKSYLAADEATRFGEYYAFANYLAESGHLIIIGFEKQQIISHRGIIKGINPNAGNPLYGFADWEIELG